MASFFFAFEWLIVAFSEPRIEFRPVVGQVVQTQEYGPRLFVGVKAKF